MSKSPLLNYRPDLRDRLAMPETYPGLAAKARADRFLLVVRRPSLMLASAYALFLEDQTWTVRRVQVDHDSAALATAQASFGADADIEASVARRQIERVRRMLPLRAAPPEDGMIWIDGPDTFEVDLDGRVSSFRATPEFAAEADIMDELTAELDRLLPASTLRMRRGRSRVDDE